MEKYGVPFYGMNLSVGLSIQLQGFGVGVAKGAGGESQGVFVDWCPVVDERLNSHQQRKAGPGSSARAANPAAAARSTRSRRWAPSPAIPVCACQSINYI